MVVALDSDTVARQPLRGDSLHISCRLQEKSDALDLISIDGQVEASPARMVPATALGLASE